MAGARYGEPRGGCLVSVCFVVSEEQEVSGCSRGAPRLILEEGEYGVRQQPMRRDLSSFLTSFVLYIKTGSGKVQSVRLHELTHLVVCQGQEDSDPELCMLYSFTV